MTHAFICGVRRPHPSTYSRKTTADLTPELARAGLKYVRHLQYNFITSCRPLPVYHRYLSNRDRPLHAYLVIDCWLAVNDFDSPCKAVHRSNGLCVSSSLKFQGDTRLVHQRTASRPSRSTRNRTIRSIIVYSLPGSTNRPRKR